MSKSDNNKDDKREAPWSEAIKKVVSIGVGAAFMTEEAVKTALNDLPLPKDVVTGLIQNAKSAKEDFTNSMRQELKNKLDKVDPQKIVEELVENYDVDVKATFSFRKKEESKAKK
jgi:polyhydroxyalkanoate synthesis regulator phasin